MINIQIRSLELKDTDTLTGVVSQVRTVLNVEGDGMFRNFDLDPPTSGSFIPLENVTDEIVKGWVKPKLEPFIPDIKKRIFQQNEAKKKKAVKQFNPETGETSYGRPDHVKAWKEGMSLESGEKIYHTWETTETYESGSVDDQGNPISGSMVTEHVDFFVSRLPHKAQANIPPQAASALYKSVFMFEDEKMEWSKPKGMPDAFQVGEEVIHNGKDYRSLINDNLKEPGTDVDAWEII